MMPIMNNEELKEQSTSVLSAYLAETKGSKLKVCDKMGIPSGWQEQFPNCEFVTGKSKGWTFVLAMNEDKIAGAKSLPPKSLV